MISIQKNDFIKQLFYVGLCDIQDLQNLHFHGIVFISFIVIV